MTLKTDPFSRMLFAPEDDSGGGAEPKTDADAKTGDDAKGADDQEIEGLDGKSALGGAEAGREGDAKEGDKGKEGEKTEEKVEVPEKFEIKAPEGFAALDDAALEAATPILKELGVTTSEKAQEVVNAFAKDVLPKMIERASAAAQTAQVEQIATIRKEWHDALLADKEVGGADHDAKLAIAAKAVDVFGSPELRKLFNDTGIGNHPEVVRAFYRAGLQVQEGAMHRSDGGEQRKKDDGELFYSNDYQRKDAA